MRYHELKETPIQDFELVGNWGDKEKSNSFSDKRDRAILQSPKAVDKIKRQFGKTEVDFNFYFVNSPGAGKHSETGEIKYADIQNMFKKDIADDLMSKIKEDSDAINIIYVGNAGFRKKIMTGWLIAHRMGHVFNRNFNDRYTQWKQMENHFIGQMKDIWEDGYNYEISTKYGSSDWSSNPATAKFFEAIGTMKSARDRNLGGRPYEFLYEMFAQYLIGGEVKFNQLPKSFGLKGKMNYRLNPELEEDLNDHLEMIGSDMTYMFDDVLSAAINRIYVM